MQLFYRQFGEGRPLIILHGIFGVSDNWVTIGKRIAESFSVYIPDQRNHGRSPHSDFFTYPALVEDLREFITEHELENPILIGHSMGGKVAMNYALEYPEETGKLVVVDISVRKYPGRQAHQKLLDAMLSIDFDKVNSRAEVDRQLEECIDSFRVRQFILKNLQRVNRDRLGWRMNVEALSANLYNVFEGVEGMGRTYEGEVMFVRGGASEYIPLEDDSPIRSLFPKASIRTIGGATHWVHADAPDELCALFSEFLQKDCVFRY